MTQFNWIKSFFFLFFWTNWIRSRWGQHVPPIWRVYASRQGHQQARDSRPLPVHPYASASSVSSKIRCRCLLRFISLARPRAAFQHHLRWLPPSDSTAASLPPPVRANPAATYRRELMSRPRPRPVPSPPPVKHRPTPQPTSATMLPCTPYFFSKVTSYWSSLTTLRRKTLT